MEEKEYIVLTPKGKTSNSTTLCIERKKIENQTTGGKVYVAGGDHQGIIVNKEPTNGEQIITPPSLSIEFKVFLINISNGKHVQEARTLRFWFQEGLQTNPEQAAVAQEFFGDLIHPKDFPRDYVGFIKKIMKLLQNKFPEILRIELLLREITGYEFIERSQSPEDSNSEKVIKLTKERVIEVMESLYPNPVTVEDLAREYNWIEEEVRELLNELQKEEIIRLLDYERFTRTTRGDGEVKIVKQMPKIMKAHQPTIAIITAQFTEKLAVDAMIDNKETFVKYTTVGSDNKSMRTNFGESNVYTLGNIGEHRVVCTKLPSIGRSREAMIAAGSTTTRLLGTFQNVNHIILVGVGGGVPHFMNYEKHVRLGDVVISCASSKSDSVYIHCEEITETNPGVFSFHAKEYCSLNSILQNIANKLKNELTLKDSERIWEYLDEGHEVLKQSSEHDFDRPHCDTDKLYMAIGERDLIEVAHPEPRTGDLKRSENRPRLHLGVVGAGREVSWSDLFRQKFSQEHNILTYVSEFDPVIESIIGNCRDSFMFIRGISDYKDGTKRTEWQSYAALAAASVTKAIILALRPSYT